jgi:hypothetical protein
MLTKSAVCFTTQDQKIVQTAKHHFVPDLKYAIATDFERDLNNSKE